MKKLVIFTLLSIVLCDFDPYVDNFGTIVGIAGRNFSLLAGDTRLSDQYMIRSRNHSKLFEINDNVCFSGSGCWSDICEAAKVLSLQAREFNWESKRAFTVDEASFMLSQTLYQRRFFPYYTFSLLTGMDTDGVGAVFRYDAVGSFERVRAACAGKGEKLIQPFLDEVGNMDSDDALWGEFDTGTQRFAMASKRDDPLFATNILRGVSGAGNINPVEIGRDGDNAVNESASKRKSMPYLDISEDDACDLVLKGFLAATEREISVGDGLEIWIRRLESSSEDTISHTSDSDETKHTLTESSTESSRLVMANRVSFKRRGRFILEKRFYTLPEH